VTTPSPGTFCVSIPKSVALCSTNMSYSSKLPGSSSTERRSRAVRRPFACCASMRFSPPPSRASSRLFSSSSMVVAKRFSPRPWLLPRDVRRVNRAHCRLLHRSIGQISVNLSQYCGTVALRGPFMFWANHNKEFKPKMLTRVGVPVESEAEPSAQDPQSTTLVCFSHLRWNFVFQRPQHLMSRFAHEMTVIFWEEP